MTEKAWKWIATTIMFITPVIAAAWRENYWLLFIELVVIGLVVLNDES